MGADEADREAPESGGVFGAVAGTDAATVFVEGRVEDVVCGFDAPVSAIEGEEALGAGGVGAVTGDAVGVLDAAFTGGFVDDGALDEEGLFDMGKERKWLRRVVDQMARDSSRPCWSWSGSRKSGSRRCWKKHSRSASTVGWLALTVNTKWAPRRWRYWARVRCVSRASVVPVRSSSRASSMGTTVPISLVRLVSSLVPTGRRPTFFGCA